MLGGIRERWNFHPASGAAMRGTKPEWFPAAPVIAILHGWLALQDPDLGREACLSVGWKNKQGGGKDPLVGPFTSLARLANDSGVSQDVLWKLKCDRSKRWLDFDTADRLVCAINPFLWHSDPELASAYQAFDLGRLDEYRPVTERLAA